MKLALPALLLLTADAGEAPRGLDPTACGLLKTVAPLGGELYGTAFSPDGARLALGCGPEVRVYETAGWTELARLEGHPQHVYSTAFSKDGRTIAAGGFEGLIQLWDAETRRPLRTLAGHGTFVSALAFSPDGLRLLSGALDGSLRVWDLGEGGRAKDLPGRPGGVTDVAFAGDRALTTGVDGKVHVWKTDSWELERSFELAPGAEGRWFSFAPGGRRVAGVTAEGLVAGEAAGGAAVRRIEGAEATLCRPTADGRYVIAAAGPRRVRILDLARGGAAADLVHHLGEVTSIAIHPAGRIFATTGQDRHLKIWGRVAGGMAAVRPRGFLGVRLQQDAAGGTYLAEVIAGTPAQAAGLQAGDVVRRVAGRPLASPTEATDLIGSFQEGDEVEFVLDRGGAERTSRIKLGRRPAELDP